MRQKQKEMQEELERKIELIQQIKLLERQASTHQKDIDLTESSKFGLLSEMSVVEVSKA